jgi:hypothetical protein
MKEWENTCEFERTPDELAAACIGYGRTHLGLHRQVFLKWVGEHRPELNSLTLQAAIEDIRQIGRYYADLPRRMPAARPCRTPLINRQIVRTRPTAFCTSRLPRLGTQWPRLVRIRGPWGDFGSPRDGDVGRQLRARGRRVREQRQNGLGAATVHWGECCIWRGVIGSLYFPSRRNADHASVA